MPGWYLAPAGHTVWDMLGGIIAIIAAGFFIGALGRLAIPGPDPMPFWLTVFIGMGGSIVGGAVASAIYGPSNTFSSSNNAFVSLLLEVGVAVAIVAAYRRYVQRRPLSGPEAHRFPSRGFGIEQMRERLRRAGVDPDKLTTRPEAVTPTQPDELTPEQVAHELEKLREARAAGSISEDEFERERERLRRY